MTWQQFSIKAGRFPVEEVKNLPPYSRRWHFLFEPQLLVRVENEVIVLPQNAEWGDGAQSSPSGDNGRFFGGEQRFYGHELWEANADFLHANAALVKQLVKEGRNNYKMQRKHVHLLCNQFGMNYWRESVFLLRSAIRSFYLYLKYGGR